MPRFINSRVVMDPKSGTQIPGHAMGWKTVPVNFWGRVSY